MSSVVQQQHFYTRIGQLSLIVGTIALAGLYPYSIQVGSFAFDVFSIIASCCVLQLVLLKLMQRDMVGTFLAAIAGSMLFAPENLFAGFLSIKIALFILSLAPLAFVAQADEGTRELMESAAELRREVRRVSWPSVQETLKFVAIVSLFVVGAAIFWAFVDRIIQAVFSILFYYFA